MTRIYRFQISQCSGSLRHPPNSEPVVQEERDPGTAIVSSQALFMAAWKSLASPKS